MTLPFHICDLATRRLTAFKNFLNASGAEIFSSSNACEALRRMPRANADRASLAVG